MTLKRLLNPTDYGDADHPDRRPQPTAWETGEDPNDDNPILRDQSWGEVLVEALGPEDFQSTWSRGPDEDVLDSSSALYAQKEMAQWAAENLASTITSVTPQPEVEDEGAQICYGMIYRASVKLRGDMAELDAKLSTGGGHPAEGYHSMKVTRSDTQLFVVFPDGFSMGELNAQLEKALDRIFGQVDIDFEVLTHIRSVRETIGRATKEKDAIVRVNINLYGPRNQAKQVGVHLSQNKVYLQRPDFLRSGCVYDNPHVLKLPQFQPSEQACIVPVGTERDPAADKAEVFKKTISQVYSSLKRGQRLVGLEGDDRLRTSLLQHQMEALDFLTQRENGPVPDEFSLWSPDEVDGQPCFRHAITNTISRIPPIETGGGILADEMGMGKTLSILALILRTLGEAHAWVAQSNKVGDFSPEALAERKSRPRARATLIIASSDLMINEWFQEIERHFHHQVSGVIKTIKYHGQYRETEVTKLCDADLIITTYHTLASDFSGKRNPLNEIEWYRLVLDEAHIIRRQSTVLYRTVAELKARSRWCLTGTPIQNRLEDIGSLFAFLRISPFHSMSTFRKFIATPFDEGEKRSKIAIDRFTRLLDSLCLRRTKELLHLPAQQDRVRMLEFTAEEREQYEQTKKMMIRTVRNQVGIFEHKSTLGMFQIQLQLRILCNHGTFQQPFSWSRRSLHLLDEREDMESSLGRDGEITCSSCRQVMPIVGSSSLYRRYTDHCRHVLCMECIEDSMPVGQETLATLCPLCASLWGPSGIVPPHTQTSRQSTVSDNENYFRPTGYSSKMMALMDDVQENVWNTKSIIFSHWTRTLDLIQMYLGNGSINSARIDGECPTAKREKILEDFAKNPLLRVLIMTTGTGAVGLNLATANRVFIVEPQWNPSVENQAVARALRLGQENSVQVTRYVINKTVEQEMRYQQDRKLRIAGIGWE
ncbi:SNF2 family N-terminal domain-domain-containing protein [Clohesyomyces aquaticus]|uniref:SNF2 family N-terminal domain-domain-containing protein n=1 Tax=Clohesyomyces aquaticus TaxID=1231657 RepID=A0A1Y2A0X8_9PLEO|nr:SNF2 family N-terminal domain-domain-containing protein [Clohesyomyces aquaticus]